MEKFDIEFLDDEFLTDVIRAILNSEIKNAMLMQFTNRIKIDGYNLVFIDLDGIKLCYGFIGKSYSAISELNVIVNDYLESLDV